MYFVRLQFSVRNIKLLLLPLLFLLSTQHCVAEDNVGSSKVYNKQFNSVWKATIVALSESGASITFQDKDSGIITTDWYLIKAPMFPLSKGWKYKANITIKKISNDSAEVFPKLSFQETVSKDSPWHPVSEDNKYNPKLKKDIFEAIQKNL